MKPNYTTVLSVICALFLTACSTTVENAADQKAKINRPANAASASNSDGPISNQVSTEVEKEVVSQNPIGDVRKGKMDAMRKAAGNAPPVKIDTEAELKKSTRPAPENSEFAVVLTDSVFERRTFKNHPQLSKVEKTTQGEQKSIKVYFTDGKFIDLPGDKIEFVSTASSASILKAAGMGALPETRKPKS